MKQQKVWDKIAKPWKTFRVKPVEEVKEFLKNKKGRVLDLGCGTGRNFIKIDGTIYGVDFSKKMLKFAENYAKENNIKIKLLKSNITNIKFNDNFFDTAVFIAVLHCITSKRKRENSLRELLRVLKPESKAMISVWNYNQKKFKNSKKESFIPWKHEGKEYLRYYYLYEKKELINLLKKVGFEMVKIMNQKNSKGVYSKKNIIVIVRKPKLTNPPAN